MDENDKRAPEDLADMDRLFERLGLESPHPPYEFLQRFVDKESVGVRERELVEQHLRVCPRCRDDIRTLAQQRILPERQWSLDTMPNVAKPLVIPRRLWSPTAGMALANVAIIGVIVLGGISYVNKEVKTAKNEADQKVKTALSNVNQQIDDATKQLKADTERKITQAQVRAQTAQDKADAAGKEMAALQRSLESNKTASETVKADLTRKLEASQRRAESAGGEVIKAQKQVAALQNTLKNASAQVAMATAEERLMQTGKLPPYAPLAEKIKGPKGESLDPFDMGSAAAAPGEFGPTAPVRTAVVSRRPTLTWNAKPGATGYTVEIKDGSDNTRITRLPADATEWQVPSGFIRRGQSYTWSVTSLPDNTIRQGRFLVAGQADASRYIEEQLRLALRLSRSGFYSDAKEVVKKVIRDVPDMTEVEKARKLLAEFEQN